MDQKDFTINEMDFATLYVVAKKGDRAAQSLLVQAYVCARSQLPEYCIDYVDGFLRNVAIDIKSGGSACSKFFPDASSRVKYGAKHKLYNSYCAYIEQGFSVRETLEKLAYEYPGFGSDSAIQKAVRQIKAVIVEAEAKVKSI
jgi:hypothetical protein